MPPRFDANGQRVIAQPPAEWLARLKQTVAYDPATGEFTFIARRGHKKPGSRAGYLNPNGYVRITACGRYAWAQQVAWYFITGAWPTKEVDHENGVRHDNRAENLREATQTQNHYNRHIATGVSRFLGVSPVRKGTKVRWVAHQRPDGYLGYFFSEEEAARAYDRAALARDPEFARTNFPRADYGAAAAA